MKLKFWGWNPTINTMKMNSLTIQRPKKAFFDMEAPNSDGPHFKKLFQNDVKQFIIARGEELT